ncbi:hypothetical protein [Edaphobacter sp.]|uniref:hypothetical protein n=1 Tax=Edaphobacter sp. TaxID=1934404 RepID=UPI002DBBB5AD|nr:hypothetical protein [Edaphobacter sp.]HEU5341177.1 hypothetical protein [Edaphobacter sp.]
MKSPLWLRPVIAALFLCLCVGPSACWGTGPETASYAQSATLPKPVAADTVNIPGPLRSFLRMAGISQKISAHDVMPLLARNVFSHGYEDGHQPTEFLRLLDRYLDQATELQILAGSHNTIEVTNCDDAGTLIQILGYRLRPGCGTTSFSLETANPDRAFLTIDSGFPLEQLEEALQTGKPFVLKYTPTQVPILLKERDWIVLASSKDRGFGKGNLVDVLLYNPDIARLYWALSKSDDETRTAMARSTGLRRLLPFADTLDFYGSQISIHEGRVAVPGGPSAVAGWKELVGVSPSAPGEFVPRLLAKDRGWLAAYFDVLSRVDQQQQARLTEGARLRHLYEAFRDPDLDTDASRGAFRKAADLLVLYTRLEWDQNGEPRIPGNLDVWQQVFAQKSDSKVVRNWGKKAQGWTRPEQLLEGLTAMSRVSTDQGPLQIYLMISEIDRRRPVSDRLAPGTVAELAKKYAEYGNWYLVFSDFPELADQSILRFVNIAESIDKISNQNLRANVMGSFQANIGLWQILARQGEIPASARNDSWQKVIDPFNKVTTSIQLFDAARSSLSEMLKAAGGSGSNPQEEIVDLLAGPHQTSADGQWVQEQIASRIRSVMDDQRLVSLNTLFALGDGLNKMANGGARDSSLLGLAGELREFELPQPIFTENEKITWAPGIYRSHHAELQVQTDLSKVIKAPGTRAQLETARGQLAPFLRDTLVGLNYAYYEPPGAQMLHDNPLFVRSHDFTGISVVGAEDPWRSPMLLGVGTPAGGGAYLMGSLADLPYSLATAEQEFISPANVQALIWEELVPQLLVNATLPRWWNVSHNELHAVALYQRAGEELLTASVKDDALRSKVLGILSDRMSPQRIEETMEALRTSDSMNAMLPKLMPSDTFFLTAEFREKYPSEAASYGPAGQQLDALCHQDPAETSRDRIAEDFGVPHPTLAQTDSLELLHLKQLPFFAGYSSRLFGESWESSNLYWARLADEMGYQPVMLNRLVPLLTLNMTANIFATNLDDWPALLRAMHETGAELRAGKIKLGPTAGQRNASLEETTKDATAQ